VREREKIDGRHRVNNRMREINRKTDKQEEKIEITRERERGRRKKHTLRNTER
jgi:hypothetical protein